MEPQVPNTRRNRLLLVGLALVAVVVLFMVFTRNNNDIDVLPEEGTSIDYSNQSVLFASKESRELFQELGTASRYDSFGRDLYVFAKDNYDQYTNGGKVIGFKITSQIKAENQNISFSGRYGASSNEIAITIKLLPNDRLSTTITDQKTNQSAGDSLPSNSKRNRVISELPIRSEQYYISYDKSGDSFVINIYDGGSAQLDQATKALAQKLGVNDLGQERYSFVRSGGGGILSPKPVVDNHADDHSE